MSDIGAIMPRLENCSINNLSVNIMLRIFSYLSIREKIKFQRVCKSWKSLTKASLREIKRLDFNNDEWGASKDNEIVVTSNVLEQVLKVCGKRLRQVNFFMLRDVEYLHLGLRDIDAYELLARYCPNLHTINISRFEPTYEGSDFFTKNFRGVICLCIGNDWTNYEEMLSSFFSENKLLYRLDLKHVKMQGRSLLHISQDSLTTMSIEKSKINLDTLCHALRRLRKLAVFDISDEWDTHEPRTIAKQIESFSEDSNLEVLNFHHSGLDESHFKLDDLDTSRLRNLETLTFYNFLLGRKLINNLRQNCENLSHISLIMVHTTDEALQKITSLPKLKFLRLDTMCHNIEHFIGNETYLEIIELHYCPSLTTDSVKELLQVADNLRMLRVSHCNNISERDMIVDALMIMKEDVSNRTLTIDFCSYPIRHTQIDEVTSQLHIRRPKINSKV